MSVIETSKLLLECAEYHDDQERIFRKGGLMEESANRHKAWAESVRQIAIPEPREKDSDIVVLLP